MKKLEGSVQELLHMDEISSRDTWLNNLHPIVKLIVTIVYIMITVSLPKYEMAAITLMAVYPVILFIIGEISFRDSIRRLKVVLPIVCMVGILNPVFDRQPVSLTKEIVITSGVISMITLMMKGILCVFASYLLIVSTSIENICYTLRMFHVPTMIVTQILLTYRYISLLLTEVEKTIDAYTLRAPGQKGIHIMTWGSLVGGLLLRSIDRASVLYESMILRGYHGEFYYNSNKRIKKKDIGYLLIWVLFFIIVKISVYAF